jgi:hypothetical protein
MGQLLAGDFPVEFLWRNFPKDLEFRLDFFQQKTEAKVIYSAGYGFRVQYPTSVRLLLWLMRIIKVEKMLSADL